MQIMEGDVIRNITHHGYWAITHWGKPGRNEIDETQELNFRHLPAIVDTGFKGYVALNSFQGVTLAAFARRFEPAMLKFLRRFPSKVWLFWGAFLSAQDGFPANLPRHLS